MDVRHAGDRAVVFEFGDAISATLVNHVRQLDQRITAACALNPDKPWSSIVETVPTFRSLAVIFDPLQATPAEIVEAIGSLPPVDTNDAGDGARAWQLPVCYGGDHGPDLHAVAMAQGLTAEDVIDRHLNTPVSVYLLGFLPGFAFMGDTDEALHLPRRTDPRLRIPAGSVGIAMSLTAVYPWESPGGWHLIGHSPVPLFDASQVPAALLAPGDSVSFRRIDDEEHRELVDALAQDAIDTHAFMIAPDD